MENDRSRICLQYTKEKGLYNPLYDKFILPMSAIVAMYQKIRPSANGLWEILAMFNMPYTFLKCVVISIIALLISKPLRSILKIQ